MLGSRTKDALRGTPITMRRSSKLAILGVPVALVTAFLLFVPAFYWFAAYGPEMSVKPTVIFTAYRSLGCRFLGFGDEYFTGLVTLSSSPYVPASGLVFSCKSPVLPR